MMEPDLEVEQERIEKIEAMFEAPTQIGRAHV